MSLKSIKTQLAAAGATMTAALSTAVVHAAGYNTPNDILKGDKSNITTFATMVMKFVGPLQTICTAILVCVAVVLGLKIGAASVSGDPRSRTSSIVGLFFVIIGEFVILHAQAVVAIVNQIN